jgi:hypothetical protein
MWSVDPDMMMVAYVASALERYCREEGFPAKSLPDLVPNDDDVLAGVQRALRAVRGVLTALSPRRQRRPGHARPGAVAE